MGARGITGSRGNIFCTVGAGVGVITGILMICRSTVGAGVKGLRVTMRRGVGSGVTSFRVVRLMVDRGLGVGMISVGICAVTSGARIMPGLAFRAGTSMDISGLKGPTR